MQDCSIHTMTSSCRGLNAYSWKQQQSVDSSETIETSQYVCAHQRRRYCLTVLTLLPLYKRGKKNLFALTREIFFNVVGFSSKCRGQLYTVSPTVLSPGIAAYGHTASRAILSLYRWVASHWWNVWHFWQKNLLNGAPLWVLRQQDRRMRFASDLNTKQCNNTQVSL